MEWNQLMQTRCSCREYLDGQITTAQLKAVLQAGCAAPVARGQFEQLQITVVQKPELLERIDAVAKQSYGDDSFSCTRGAPTVILVSVQEMQGQISPMMMASAACQRSGKYASGRHRPGLGQRLSGQHPGGQQQL